MYQNLLFGVKRRIISEVEDAFRDHPAFSEKVTVKNKFAYEERPSYGIVISNTSASQIRMSADNYLADLKSHVRLARQTNYPGIAIEWARENALFITRRKADEDVSSQLGPTQRRFYTTTSILSGLGETHYADSPGQVDITINGVRVMAESVNGKKREVYLRQSPGSGDVVKISYYYRYLDSPGIYVIDFIEDNQFVVAPIYIIEDEVLIENTTGTDTEADLAHDTIYENSEEIYLSSIYDTAPFLLIKGTDYSINYTTGKITFLVGKSPPKNLKLTADYRYQPGFSRGPFTFSPYQENHEAIPGAIICIGRRAKKGDRQVVVISEYREQQAMIYGGHWNFSLSLKIISKDPKQMEEMVDQIVNHLWGKRKNILEFEGITLNSVEPTGESEESFIDTTGDLYYESSVDISVMSEWQRFVPYLYKIRKIFLGLEALEPDNREVIKYPALGYEKVL